MIRLRTLGLGLKLAEIRFDSFSGYYISILTILVSYKRKLFVCRTGSEYSLLYIGLYRRENDSLLFTFVLFGIPVLRFYVIPQKIRVCNACKNKVDIDEDGYGNSFFCDTCSKYMTESDTGIVKSRKI
jgi:hypothetical protein